jgi:hypothetical protein
MDKELLNLLQLFFNQYENENTFSEGCYRCNAPRDSTGVIEHDAWCSVGTSDQIATKIYNELKFKSRGA